MTAVLQIEIAYALPNIQILRKITVPLGCTVEQALAISEILQKFPEIDLAKNKLGIFGKFVQLDTQLHSNDRIEIYRPLIIDPKEIRRMRAKSSVHSDNR
ncbi:RnfH family protein [uncultured Nitrosomonas sp.]|uniref:RnfH family protein n=1 Tax=uncultured Nitrosomonas sp. TaxID=156424 RepID=UPI0025E0335B|nr:RnfH family protein [uncultured Nitrosomonas sp.]